MHLKTICLFTFILLSSSLSSVHAQDEQEKETETEVKPHHQIKLTLGVDLAQPVSPFVTEGISGYGIYFDLEPKKNIFILADIGVNSYDITKDIYSYKASGSYYKLGFAYNLMKGGKSQALVGLQYAVSAFKHEMPGLFVTNYWGNRYITFEEETLNANWLEFIGGLRVEVVKNLSLAYTLRIQIAPKVNSENFTPLYIPGYHKNRSKSSFGISYYIMYRIPLTKGE